jgi:glycosyltransferase involved in cell wall biosynthesis
VHGFGTTGEDPAHSGPTLVPAPKHGSSGDARHAVSVVIPSYNAAPYLPAALASVLTQGKEILEVLVIDDGSTDATERTMAQYGPPVRYIRQPNRGVAHARNLGIGESRGRFVAFLDADDTWLPGKVTRQLAALDEHSSCGLCYSAFLVVDRGLNPLELRRSNRHGSALEDLLTKGNVVGSVCTVIVERSLLFRAGRFDPALSQCADWDLWLRLATLTDFLYLDEPLVTYRQHESNMSRDARLLERDSVHVLEKAFSLPGLSIHLRAKRRSALARNDMVLAGTYFHARRPLDALRCTVRSLARDPRQLAYLANYPSRALKRL